MKNLVIPIALGLILCSGCSSNSGTNILKVIPDNNFKTFSYDRTGFGGTNHIYATDGKMIDGVFTVQHVEGKLVTPVVTIETIIEMNVP